MTTLVLYAITPLRHRVPILEIPSSNVRTEVRTWLKDNWDPEMSLVAWRNKTSAMRSRAATICN
jgi:hypothetical protein